VTTSATGIARLAFCAEVISLAFAGSLTMAVQAALDLAFSGTSCPAASAASWGIRAENV
jgi:hypothetical protein